MGIFGKSREEEHAETLANIERLERELLPDLVAEPEPVKQRHLALVRAPTLQLPWKVDPKTGGMVLGKERYISESEWTHTVHGSATCSVPISATPRMLRKIIG